MAQIAEPRAKLKFICQLKAVEDKTGTGHDHQPDLGSSEEVQRRYPDGADMKDYGLDIRVNTGRLQPTTGRLQPTTGRLQYGQGVFRDSWTYERLRYGQDVLRAACTHGRLQHDYRTTGQLQHDYSTATGRLQDDHYRLQDDDSTVRTCPRPPSHI